MEREVVEMIQRYECEEYSSRAMGETYYDHHMVRDPDGDYVLYSDHAAALAEKDEQIAALIAERDRLRKELWKIDKTLTGSSCSYCRRVHDILHKALAAQEGVEVVIPLNELLDDTLKYAKDTQARLRQEGVKP